MKLHAINRQKFSEKKKDSIFLVVVTLFSLLTHGFYTYYTFTNSIIYNSDMLFYMMGGRDVFLNGNILLENWYGGATNTYYLLILLYGALGRVFGYNFSLVIIVSAIVFALMVFVFNYILLRHSTKKGIERYISGILFLAILYFSTYMDASTVILAGGINGGLHLDVALITFFYFHFLSYNEGKQVSVRQWMLVYFILFMAMLSDGLAVNFTILPLALVTFYHIVFNKPRKHYLINHLIASVIVVVIAKFLLSLWVHIFMQNEVYLYTVSTDQLFDRLAILMDTILQLFGANLFGQLVGADLAPGILVAVLVFGLSVLLFVQRNRWKDKLMNQICLMSLLVTILIIWLLNYIKGGIIYFTQRMLYVFFFSALFLWSNIDFEEAAKWLNTKKKYLYYACVITSAALFAFSIKRMPEQDISQGNNKYSDIVQAIKEEGLTNGFASYTNTFAIMVASDFSLNISTLFSDPATVFTMLNKVPSGTEYANFVVVDDNEAWVTLTAESIVKTIGTPDKVIDRDNLHLYVWNKNILPYIRNVESNISSYNAASLLYTKEVKQMGDTIFMKNDTILYGPMVSVERGKYRITYFGESLTGLIPWIFSYHAYHENIPIDVVVLEHLDDRIVIEGTFATDVPDVEYRLTNESGKTAGVRYIEVERIEGNE